MNELSEILAAATANIPPEYFYLAIDGGDPIYRERVYCYELYHQMRSIWPNGTAYYLNGEIDKAAHPILRELGADYAKPDLLVHRPGYMEGNHAVIEVKTSDARAQGIKKDLETLSLFIRRVGYRRAIYLMYGDDADERLVERVRGHAARIVELAPIELWLHSRVGHQATCQTTLVLG